MHIDDDDILLALRQAILQMRAQFAPLGVDGKQARFIQFDECERICVRVVQVARRNKRTRGIRPRIHRHVDELQVCICDRAGIGRAQVFTWQHVLLQPARMLLTIDDFEVCRTKGMHAGAGVCCRALGRITGQAARPERGLDARRQSEHEQQERAGQREVFQIKWLSTNNHEMKTRFAGIAKCHRAVQAHMAVLEVGQGLPIRAANGQGRLTCAAPQ